MDRTCVEYVLFSLEKISLASPIFILIIVTVKPDQAWPQRMHY